MQIQERAWRRVHATACRVVRGPFRSKGCTVRRSAGGGATGASVGPRHQNIVCRIARYPVALWRSSRVASVEIHAHADALHPQRYLIEHNVDTNRPEAPVDTNVGAGSRRCRRLPMLC